MDPGGVRGLETVGDLVADECWDLRGNERREFMPLLGGSAGVAEDETRIVSGKGVGEGGIPQEAGDVIDDLRAGCEGGLGGPGVVGVDGEDGVRMLVAEGLEGGEKAGLFLVRGKRGRVGTGGLGAEVEEVGAVGEQDAGLLKGGVHGGDMAGAIGEGVRGEIQDSHEQGSLTEGEGAGAEMPGQVGAGVVHSC